MPTALRMRSLFAVLVLCFLAGVPAFAQMETATLSGVISDPNGGVVPDVEVTATRIETGTVVTTKTNGAGIYSFTGLKPGQYHLMVRKQGFKEIAIKEFELFVQDKLEQNFSLEIGSVSESVTVNANDSHINTQDAAVSTVVDQRLVKDLALNGRSFQTLFQLTPGVVITPTSFASQGQFSVNGQRSNANYFMVDGASATMGIAAGAQPGESLGGSLPALSASGGTNSLVSTDAVQEFAIQTSSYAPEFGRTPGAQVSIVTRSGTNDFHGDVFNYFRNDVLDANDWFANRNRAKRAALRQNDFGGVVGGPIIRSRTFFFFSYEGLRLRQPTTAQSDVPSLQTRSSAPAAILPFLNAYPLPNGADGANGLAPAFYAFSNPSTLDAISIRVDHHVSKTLWLFGRYNNAPSNATTRGSGNNPLSDTTTTALTLQTLTLGGSYFITPNVSNDVRFNWSRSEGTVLAQLDSFGGAVPLSPKLLFPNPFSERDSVFAVTISAAAQHGGLQFGRNIANAQRQINIVDNFGVQTGVHALKVGVDFRRLTPDFVPPVYLQSNSFTSIASALSLQTTITAVQAALPVDAIFSNYSLYAQDAWRINSRLSLTYGIRWDFNPTPTGHGSNGVAPFAINGINNLATLSLAPAGTPIYHATANNFAPRAGIAYRLFSGPEGDSVLRAGAGIFYDLGNGPAGNAFGQFFPFLALKVAFGAPFPLTGVDAQPPVISSSPPVTGPVTAFPATLKLPYTYHFNFSIEQGLGPNQTLTVGYIGAIGHQLLRTEQYLGPPLPATFQSAVFATNNAGMSNYSALQMQFRRHLATGLDVLGSYAWSHSLDNVSSDAILSIPGQFVNPRIDYGPSDFDIRHVGSIAIDYQLPSRYKNALSRALLGGWAVDSMVTAHSAPPVNITVSRNIGFGTYNFRPDLVPNVPLFINDSTVPGGTRINPAAFALPSTQRQGNLGRNFLPGFSLFQADLAVRRHFRLSENLGLQARVDAFNIFNHPNFSPPAGVLGSVIGTGPLTLRNGFGISPSMLNHGLQTGSFGSGFSPLYQIGGPRSLQLSLKLEF